MNLKPIMHCSLHKTPKHATCENYSRTRAMQQGLKFRKLNSCKKLSSLVEVDASSV